MKKLLILIYLIAICMNGCAKQKPEAELTKDNFSNLNSLFGKPKLDVIKVYISCPHSNWDNSKQIYKAYSYYFPIDITKGEVILICIKEANQTSYDIKRTFERRDSKKGRHAIFIFETKNIKYSIPIFWDNESAYGYWWDSPELLSIFRGWGLFEDLAKADPNWPPTGWFKNIPNEMDPNDRYRSRNGVYQRGRNINEVNDESKDINTPAK
jgi:hypothetical protein